MCEKAPGSWAYDASEPETICELFVGLLAKLILHTNQ